MNSSTKRVFYDLVWREAKRLLIHEYIFTYRVGEPVTDGEWNLYRSFSPLRASGKTFYRRPEDSCQGPYPAIDIELPLPEQGGIPIEKDGKVVTRIFMDDLILCPECCRFDSSECGDYKMPWLDIVNRKIDADVLLAVIDKRKDTEEFTFKQCKNRNFCEERAERYKRQYNAETEKAKRETKEMAQQAMEIRRRQKEEEAYAALKHCVYLIEGNGHHKIGITSDVKKRLSGLQTSNPFPLKLIKTWETPDNGLWEDYLHNKYKKYRVQREWFKLPDELLQELIAIHDLNLLKKPEHRQQ